MNGWPAAVAITRPPLVAVAVAPTSSLHDVAPAGWKNSCQNVFSGWPLWPMASVTHVPELVPMEVASGVGIERTAGVPATAGAALRDDRRGHDEGARKRCDGSPAVTPARRHRAHDPSMLLLMELASTAAKEDSVAAVAPPGSALRT